jgi:hypothetical protein
MRATIVIPNGVRDLTNPRASRKLAAVLTISTDVPRRLRGSGRQRTFFIAFARVDSNF